MSTASRRRAPGFTLTELMIVVGLIALLVALLMPLLGKMRRAAAAAACLSNLRQMGAILTMYTAEHRGRMLDYVWHTPKTPDVSWNGYWLGLLGQHHFRQEGLLCPSAPEPLLTPDSVKNRGLGTATHSWTGQYSPNGTTVRLNATNFRISSYGFNRYLTAKGGFGDAGGACRITSIRNLSDVPAFFDCAFVDVVPLNGSRDKPVPAPPSLNGNLLTQTSPEHWRILLARHGRGINVQMADGSARWVTLEELYLLTWREGWEKYPLSLPRN